MGLTNNTKQLIRALTENNVQKAKQCAIACLSEDTTAKNADFVKRYKPILMNEASIIELPPNIKYKVEALDMSTVFRDDRYYKTEVIEDTVNHIMKMRSVSSELASMQIPYLNATMLYGDSGTGKTTLAKYIAYKLNLPYIYLNFSQIIDSYMGKTSSSLNLVFNFVKNNPCVFVLDEIDAIAIRRSHSSDSGADGEMNRITITLMQELDTLPNDVVLVACTNRLDRIDEALLSRFPKKIEIKNLTEDQKLDMIDQYISTINIKDAEERDKLKRNIIIAINKNKISGQRDIVNTIVNEYASILIARNS